MRFNGGHIGFPTYAYVENMEVSVEFGCYHEYRLIYTLFQINFRLIAAIFDLRHTRHRTAFPLVFSCSQPQKYGYSRWNFVAIVYRSLDIPFTNEVTCISGFTAAILNFLVISACVTIDKDLLEFTQQNT